MSKKQRRIQEFLNRYPKRYSNLKDRYLGGVYKGGEIPYIPYGTADEYPDLYPQYIISLRDGSPTLSQCVKTHAEIVFGGGFMDKDFAEMEVNKEGLTAQELLERTAYDLALFGGFAWHVKYNGLLNLADVSLAPMEKIRLGVPDNVGSPIEKIGITNEYDSLFDSIAPTNYYRIDYYDYFNPDKKFLAEKSVINEGINNYFGQIYTRFKLKAGARWYPKADYHACLKDAETEKDICESLQYDVQDRWKPQFIATHYGDSNPTPEKREEVAKEYEPFTGTDGSRFKVNFSRNKESKPDLDQVPTIDISKSYQFASDYVEKKIRRSFLYPDVIYGIATAGALGQRNELESSIAYANHIAKKDRGILEMAFKRVFTRFVSRKKQAPRGDFSIVPYSMFQAEEKIESNDNT